MRVFILCLLSAAAAAVFLFETSYAQERPEYEYVDLVMRYELAPVDNKSKVAYTVENIGTATASGVTVSFRLEDLKAIGLLNTPHLSDKKIVDSAPDQGFTEFTWEVGTIPPGGTAQSLIFSTSLLSSQTTHLVGVINATASSLQPEPDVLLANNVIKVYSYTESGKRHMDGNRLALLLSVDNLRPLAGGDVEFGLTASNLNPNADTQFINLIANAKVKVELSKGLKFKDNWPPDGTPFEIAEGSDRRSGTWSPSDTDTDGGDNLSDDIDIETQLTSGSQAPDSLDDIPLKERCITARVEDSIPPPSPDYAFGSLKQCLGGDDPLIMFEDGNLDLFYLHLCAGVTPIAYPCRDENSDSTVDNGLELVVRAVEVDQPVLRRSGVARSDGGSGEGAYIYLRPEDTVLRVDPEVRDGTKWSTGSDENTDANDAGLIPGVLAHLDFLGAAGKPYSFAIADVNPKKRPGSMSIPRMDNTGFTLLDADTQTSRPSVNSNLDVIPLLVQFGTLGTYEVDLTMGGTISSTAYTDKGTYTFHVGPVAELEVRDGGGNPLLPAGQRAYTIAAVNNGPDTAPAAQVTLTGVPAGATVGSISHGSYDAPTGTWTIRNLESAEYRRISGQRDGAILTLLTGAAEGTEITAAISISNTEDYQVCIDSSGDDVDASDETTCTGTTGNTWHTTKYYDYNEVNNTATIAPRPGSGGTTALRTSQSTAGIGLSWTPQDGAAAYGIEVSEDGGVTWLPLEPWRVVRDASYTHTGVPVGQTRHYRVHAIDSEGRRGLPFASSSARAGGAATPSGPVGGSAGPPTNVSAARSETDLAGTVKVSWDAPLNDGGSRIMGYQAQWSATGTEGWSDACSAGPAERSCEHTGLSGDGPRYYRVAARNARGLGAWSHPPAEVGRQPGDCDVPAVAADGSPVAGSWGDDCESAAREGSQARYYQFTLADSADVTVRLESEDARPALYLREGAGVTSGAHIGFNEGEAEYDHRRASIKAGLEPGTYTIEATTYAAGETGDFTLTVGQAVGCHARKITTNGSQAAGSWGDDCESTAREGSQARYYQFTLAESAYVTVRLESEDTETVLYLREGAGVTSGETTPGGFNEGESEYDYLRASIEGSLEPGTYTIEATTYAAGETGDFTLTVSRAIGCEAVEAPADGSPVAGSWGGDCVSTEREGRQARFYQFTLAESAYITVRLASDDAATVLYLREGAGVTSGVTTPGGFNDGEPEYDYRRASIEESLTAGTYTIEATTYAAEETGDFTLTVSQAGATGGPAPSGCEVADVTADGSPVAGSWGADCESVEREGRQARYYQFALAESADVTVRLESDDAETVLYLREGAGVTTGATTPGGFNDGEQEYDYHRASIEESLEAGIYTIEATTYAAGETGDFTLTVSRTGGTSHPLLVGCEAVKVTADGSPVAGSWGADCESVEREGRQARYYQFALAENADVTVRLESDDAETVLYLREGAGVTTGATTPGGFNDGEQEYDYHRASIEESLEAGIYTIEATTYAAGETGDFTLTVSRTGGTGSGLTQAAEVPTVGSQARTLDASTPLRFTSAGQDQVSLAWDLLAAGIAWTPDALNQRRRTHYVRRRRAPRALSRTRERFRSAPTAAP